MPPKRQPPSRGSAKKAAPAQPAPPSSEDAKPNIDALNAEAELPSDPEDVQPDSTVEAIDATSPTANATPARRLATLNQSGLGSPATRGKKSVTAPKGQKRRSQPSREQLLRAEEDKRKAAEARATEEAAKTKAGPARRDGSRDSGRSRGRGRGGYMGASERREAVASGPFSAGQVSKETQRLKKRWPKGSGWSGLRVGPTGEPTPGDTAKSTTGTGGRATRSTRSRTTKPITAEDGSVTKEEAEPSADVKPILDANGDVSMVEFSYTDGGYISSDEEEERGGKRMNIEDLGVIDLTQEDAEIDPFAPVRVARVARKARSFGINADGATNQEGAITVDANDVATISTSTRKRGKQKAKEIEIVGESRSFQGVYSDSESNVEPEPRIKEEDEDEAARIGTPEPRLASDMLPQEPSSSPESKRKVKEKLKARTLSKESSAEIGDYQTREEVEEWERYQQDLDIIRAELGQPATATGLDGDAAMTDARADDTRAEKVYLFQFPPVLPDLLPVAVKPDPDAANGDLNGTDMMEVDPPSNPNKPINIQDDGKPERHQPKLPSGAVGKLKVHASGRVTLDWGGTSLSLGMGTEASFLQDVLVATLPDQKDGISTQAEAGEAVCMGQVKGKFVVTPDWEKLLQ